MVAVTPSSARLAVLIDAENASARIADGLFAEIAGIGQASVRRIYGDFSNGQLKPWTEILAKHAIVPHQNFANIAGKNASDIALVIDAMDLLHTGRFDGFCIVSSDSDFTRLAVRLREHGVDVYGFGERKTPESLRQVCRQFFFTENLLPQTHAAEAGQTTPRKALLPVSDASLLLRNTVMQMEADDGWVELGAVKNRLITLMPEFDQRTYGFSKLSELAAKTGAFEIQVRDGGTRIRLKREAAEKPSPPPRA